ncbi:MAG: transglutaminase-like domain-containing protein [Oscillospiraceae bacterium]
MKLRRILTSVLALLLLCGCSGQAAQESVSPEPDQDQMYIDAVAVADLEDIEDEAVALSAAPAPALSTVLSPVAAGTQVAKKGQAVVDYSNTQDGYVMVKCSSTRQLKVRVFGPSYAVNETKYTYDLTSGVWATLPLSDGNGAYKVVVYEQAPNTTKYATALTANFSVTLKDEFAPFLRPNQYVNYEYANETLYMAGQLTQGIDDPLEKVAKVYDYVVNNLTYDHEKANRAKNGKMADFIPVLDDVLMAKKGICFDYAALMTGMLRSQGVPCKMVIGYAGKEYHAWVSVWTAETGWVEGAVYFDGVSWQRMDPTFISSGKNSAKIQAYVADGSHYNAMYLY